MKKWILVVGLMLASVLGWGQTTSFWTDRAVGTYPSVSGVTTLIPIQYGQVRVCTFAVAPPTPCNAANGQVFDLSGNPLTVQGGNFGQITTDVVGRFSFGCVAGQGYTIQVAASSDNVPILSYPITCSQNGSLVSILGTNNAFIGTNTFSTINGVPFVGSSPGQFTIPSCLASLAVTGGICATVPNYSESESANIVFTKNQHLLFFGPAAIALNGNSITASHGADGISITSLRGEGFFGNSLGVQFTYTGTGSAVSIGDNGGNTFDVLFQGFDIKLNTASATAKGLSLFSVQHSTFDRLGISGSNSAGQQGLSVDGSFNFAGDNKFDRLEINGFPTSINLANNSNLNQFDNCSIGNVSAGGTGFNFVSGNGNVVTSCDIEGVGGGGTAVALGNNANNFGNRITIYGQGNSNDFTIGAAATGNVVDNIGATNANQIIVTGAGINNANTIINPYRATLSAGRLQTLGTSSTTCSVTGAGATGTCSIIGGSTDSFGLARINSAGAGPAATGTLTLTLGLAFTNFTFCQFTPSNGVTAWNARASFLQTNYSNSAPVLAWDNNAVALVAGNSYDVAYTCVGH